MPEPAEPPPTRTPSGAANDNAIPPVTENAAPRERFTNLKARIEALEGTSASASDLIETLHTIDPNAPGAAKQLKALEDRVAHWEREALGPADPGLGEVTDASGLRMLRKVDIVVKLPNGELVALEVKTGNATRSTYQLECDAILAASGGTEANGLA